MYTRSDEFIVTAGSVSIHSHKDDVIFKYIEINSSGQNSRGLHNHNKPAVIDFYVEVSYLFIYLVIMDLTSGQNTENLN